MIGVLGLLACFGADPAPAPAPAPAPEGPSEPAPPAVPVPPPPQAARASFTLKGAVEAVVDDAQVECRSGSADILDAAWTGQIQGQNAVLLTQTPYRITLEDGTLVERQVVAQLYVGDAQWSWDWRLEPQAVLLEPTSSTFTQWTPTNVTGKSVTVSGRLSCPSLKAASPVPDAIVALLATASGGEVVRYHHYDFGRAKDERTVSVRMERRQADALVRRLRDQLPPGWVAFRGTSRFDPETGMSGVEVVVGPGTDNRHILRLAHTAPGPWTTEQVVARIDDWDSRYGIDVFFAMDDSLGFLVHNPPDDLLPFAQELTDFCPDIVRNSLGSPEALAEAIHASGGVLLWWE